MRTNLFYQYAQNNTNNYINKLQNLHIIIRSSKEHALLSQVLPNPAVNKKKQ